jgi:predicted ArsR family transcriptional regulator
MLDHLTDELDSVGLLADPLRRRLYRYVVGQLDPVSREQAAKAVDLPLHTAKFHLDRLVKARLLETEFRRLSGRTGPGAGRPAKLYRRASRQVSVSLPERRYDLAGEVLAEAVERSVEAGTPIAEVLPGVAREAGRRLAAEGSREARSGSGTELERTAGVLSAQGYEPLVDDEQIRLANCPFDRLATQHTELVCGMNRDLIEGVIDGLDCEPLRAHLAPEAGYCCVRVAR